MVCILNICKCIVNIIKYHFYIITIIIPVIQKVTPLCQKQNNWYYLQPTSLSNPLYTATILHRRQFFFFAISLTIYFFLFFFLLFLNTDMHCDNIIVTVYCMFHATARLLVQTICDTLPQNVHVLQPSCVWSTTEHLSFGVAPKGRCSIAYLYRDHTAVGGWPSILQSLLRTSRTIALWS